MKQAMLAVGVFGALLVVVLLTRDKGNVEVGVAKLDLPQVDRAKVTSIELSGAQTVFLKKDGAGWSVADASKVFHAADEGAVNSLLEGLKDFHTELFVTEKPERVAELELDEAKGLELKVFTDAASPALDVVFGKAGKSGGTYLRAPKSNQVFLTNSRLPTDARHQALRFRKRSFFPARADKLAKIEIKKGDALALALETAGEGKWTLGAATPAPAGFRFDPLAAQRVANTLGSAWATDFIDQGGDVLFAPPQATVEATTTEGKKVTMQVGSPIPASTDGGTPSQAGTPVRLEGDPQIYVVSNDQAVHFKKSVTDLRDTTLLKLDAQQATRLTIEANRQKTVLAKEGGTWKVVEPKTMPVGVDFDPQQVAGELAHLMVLKGDALSDVPEAKAGFGKPTAKIEIAVEGGPPQQLVFGTDSSTSVLVKGSADGLVYSIDHNVLARFQTGLELFKKPPPPPNMGANGMKGLENLPPDIRRQLEAQMRQRQMQPQ